MDGECSDIRKELESWYLRDRGRYLLQSTRDALGPVLDTAFGYHILQLGLTRGQSLFENSPINHRIYACSAAGDAVTLLTCEDELPLESDSVDVVIAHHSLEFAANPHQVLRELQRVLTPQGHLLIVGFNPYSLHGLATRLRAFGGRSLWRQLRPVSENRLSDWLRLLGCETQERRHVYTVPPLGQGRLRDWLTRADQWFTRHKLPFGGLYITHAIKQVSAVHRPVRTRSRRARLIGLAAPAPAPRTGSAAREGDAPS